jgi:hypothetical protein
MFAVDGVTVTVVAPGVVGSVGDVGLVVAVFATPPHAHATSARRSGSSCTVEGLVEQLTGCIALAHLDWFCCLDIFDFDGREALLDRGVAMGQCPQR